MGEQSTADFKVSISKEELSMLPLASFRGSVKVIEHKEDVASAIALLKQSPIVGFDTETKPSFRKGQTNRVSLMQLSTTSDCFLFRLNKIGLVPELIDFLEDESVLKVGLSIHDDFLNLNKLSKLVPQGFVDLQKYVKTVKIADNSLQRIYGILFDERISKSQRLTNWEAMKLTPSQQSYAALDAVACVKIYKYIHDGHFDPEESPYMHYIVYEDNNANETH